MAPSPVYEPVYKVMPKEMNPDEIHQVIEDFCQAARRAKQAGFDGVQLHVAHGYLLSSFISPHTNKRKDEWGGTVANRSRIVVEIIKGINELLGNEFPLIVKLNSTDFLSSGLEIDEALEIAIILEKAGIDAVEVSGGMAESGEGSMLKGLRPKEKEGYFIQNASRIKSNLTIPVIGLGGLRSFSVMEQIVREGKVDFISMSRPFVRNPLLLNEFRQGKALKSSCISCNKCLNFRGIKCAELKND